MAIPNTLATVNRTEMFDPVFREVVAKQLSRLDATKASLRDVPAALQLRYRGDFYGLLKEHGINYDYWWFILRYNGYHTPTEYDGKSSYVIPSESDINSLLRNWNNTYAS